MGRPWSDGLPVVTVPRGTSPNKVTLVVPYYRSPQFLRQQIAHWASLPTDHLRIVVVDDGSPEPAEPIVREASVPIRLFRIEVDVPWNWLAARNIGAHHAETPWLLLTDMDHMIPAETLETVVYGRLDPTVVYGFARQEHTGAPIHPHSASFLMSRNMFWRIGGYDERLAGVYGTDGAYRKRMQTYATVQILSCPLVRHEYVEDSSVTTYPRKTAQMREARRKRFASVTGPPKVLSFPYHEVEVRA